MLIVDILDGHIPAPFPLASTTTFSKGPSPFSINSYHEQFGILCHNATVRVYIGTLIGNMPLCFGLVAFYTFLNLFLPIRAKPYDRIFSQSDDE